LGGMGCHSLARTLLLLGIALFGLGLAAPQESQDADQSKGALGDAALLPRNKHPALFAGEPYHEVMPLGRNYIVRDFTKGVIKLSRWWLLRRQLGRWIPLVAPPRDVGRYNECRADMYKRTVASVGESGGFGGARNIHIGVDLGAPAGTPVRNFLDGTIHKFGYNPGDGDYGHTVITRHVMKGRAVYALWGHLSGSSMARKFEGQHITAGEVVGYLGGIGENGGWWPPHLHFQLSLLEPEGHDMPGVVSAQDHARALDTFPDPRLVLGPLYPGDAFFA